MTKLLCITLFGETCGSSRIRVLQFIPFLEKNNIQCTSKKLFSDEYFKITSNQKKCNYFIKNIYLINSAIIMLLKKIKYTLIVKNYDIIIIQKDVFPLILQKIMYKRNKNIIFEFDDAIFEPSQFAKGLNKIYDKLRRKNLPYLLKKCKHIIVENNYLANYAKNYNNNVSIITAPINTNKFYKIKKKKDKKIILGWIGSAFTTNQLKLLISPLKKISEKYPDILIKLIGADRNIDLENIPVTYVKWSLETEVEELQSFDIGLMPLDDDPFNKGRLGYKIIQYMSIGIPTVASNMGLNKEIITEYENGFLASDDQEWINKLSLLIENKDLRKRMGNCGRKKAVEEYSLKIAEQKILSIIKTIAKNSAN